MNIKEFAAHPVVFGTGVGIANGVLAAARDKPVSPNGAIITALVIALGEVALVYELPEDEREPLLDLGIKSFVGTFFGMAPFVSWKKGEVSPIKQAGNYLGDKFSEYTDETKKLLALKRAR